MISKANAEHYVWGGDCDGWHLLKSDTLSVIHERMPAQRAETGHRHARARQLFFVLSGRLTMRFPDREETAGPGEAFEIPPGTWHQACNNDSDPVEFLVISAPPTRGDREESPP
jgi:mannose-6-phosphate isomerase-like protein (cupin superfamily)